MIPIFGDFAYGGRLEEREALLDTQSTQGRRDRAKWPKPVVLLLVTGFGLLVIALASLDRPEANPQAYDNSPAGRAEEARAWDAAQIEAAQTLVKMRLRDPDSATFMGGKVVRNGSKKAVCGFVNAKNGFGGMSGYDWFAVSGINAMLASDGPVAGRRIAQICGA